MRIKTIDKLKSKLKTNAASFGKDERGGIAVIAVLSLGVLAFAVGFSFDYWRASAAQTALQQAVDSTTQTITAKINACLDKTNRVTTVDGDELDTGCFDYVASGDADLDLGQALGIKAADVTDNPDIMVQDISKYKAKGSYTDTDATFKQYVLSKLRDSYTQVSYDKTRPTTEYGVGHSNTIGVSYIDGKGIGIPYLSSFSYDKKSGDIYIHAYVYYDCFMSQILIKNCRLRADATNELNDAFSQADRLLIDDPGTHEIWAEENDSPDLPVQLVASGGWTPYSYGFKTALPAGLTMNGNAGTIDGTPADVACSVASCTPQNLTASTVYVQDAGDQNRGGANKQTAYTSVGWLLVHKLKIDVDDQTLYVGDSFTSPAPTRTGGKAGFTFSWTARTDSSGAMSQTPPGMTLNTSNGIISGTPTLPSGTPGSNGLPAFTFYEKVTDGRNKISQQTVRYTVLPKPITITKDGDLSSNGPVYVETYVRYSGGYGTLTINCSGLPSGLECTDKTQTSVKISGTPNQPGSGFIDVNVSDEWAQSVQQKVYYNFVALPVTVTVDDYLKSSDAGNEPASGTTTVNSVTTTTTVVNPSEGLAGTANTTYIAKYPGLQKSIGTTFRATGGWGTLTLSCDTSALTTGAYLNSIWPLSCADNGLQSGDYYKGTVTGTLTAYSIYGTANSTYLYINGASQTRLADRNGSRYLSSPLFKAKACDSYSNCGTAEIYYDFDLYSSISTTGSSSGSTSCTVTGDGNYSSGCTNTQIATHESATTTSDGGHDTGDSNSGNSGGGKSTP